MPLFLRRTSPYRFIALGATVMLSCVACHDPTSTSAEPVALRFTGQPPESSVAGSPLPPVTVAIVSASGNTVSTEATVTLDMASNPAGAVLVGGAKTAAAINGVATFTNLIVDKAGAGYTLTATATDLTRAVSDAFEIKVGPPARLSFSAQPITTVSLASIPDILVSVVDQSGNTVPTAGNTISLSIGGAGVGANTSGIITGIVTQAAVNGVATFSNLSIARAGNGYAIFATSPGLGAAISSQFSITPGPASRVAFTATPLTTTPGTPFSPAIAVAIQDKAGNNVTTPARTVTLAIGTNPTGAMLSGNTTAVTVNGIASFSDISVDKAGTGYTLMASAPDLVPAASNSFTVRPRLSFTAVGAGYFHTCALTTDGGSTYCWGDNSTDQLGNASVGSANTPIAALGGLAFATINSGRNHTCGVTDAGVGYCWGLNASGQLGNGGHASGTPVSGGIEFASISAGYDHTCGVDKHGVGYCWGANFAGQAAGTALQTSVPEIVSTELRFANIAPGRDFTCGASTTGTAYCWGTNSGGWLGDGTNVPRQNPVPVANEADFAFAAAGGFHACGLKRTGAAYCWGANASGTLGNASFTDSRTPVEVSGGLVFRSLSVGNRHTCALTTSGLAYCWGENSDGKLGNGTLVTSNVPVAVGGGHVFTTISAGRFHTCGVTTDNEMYCWGSGSLGDGANAIRSLPVRVQ